ncbi:peptidyl-prolyl cis-trans isomerase [Bacillus aquiflavi]|uniref:peptidylprolyl isomerase n=1 Tax=Bacillus aquiflavi TaxID=2672567 RepID=A0A6B3W5R2_9BACI|nr:peptidyl-prolyl cis-trans isomerase [Bacillus aquiflavi]NEY82774.1 peptidylprolyl isomerase [Bacillus aquiflavi]
MTRKQLWIIIAALILVNCITIVFFIAKDKFGKADETVATVGKETITRQEWLKEIEVRYGREVLEDLVNQKVIELAVDKYGIKMSDKKLEQELTMLKTIYGPYYQNQSIDEERWKEQIKYTLFLEELLTKDVKVSEKELKKYYLENKRRFNIPPSYHISQIIVKTKKEAEQVIKELKDGSNFSVLAMERSIDEFSANQGGDLGYVSKDDERFSPAFFLEIEKLKPGQWSKPSKIEQGYVIVLLHERIKGKKYSYKEVKDQIRRQIALEQMDMPISTKPFWKEIGVEWFYGKKEK